MMHRTQRRATPTEFAAIAREYGATDVEIDEDFETYTTRIRVTNMPSDSLRYLRDDIQRMRPAGTQTIIELVDNLPPSESSDERSADDVVDSTPPQPVSVSASAQTPDERIEQAKERYVSGDIGILELEDRLDSALDEKIDTLL